MIYQFLCWRMARRTMCMVRDVEQCFTRLRSINNGKLPMMLDTWEDLLAFAGEAGIVLPEMEAVARSVIYSDQYPKIEWLQNRYTEMLLYLFKDESTRPLVIDPPPAVVTAPALAFGQIVEGSVSNTAGEECSAPNLAISSPTGT